MRNYDDLGAGRPRLGVEPDDWDHYELTDEFEVFLREAGTPQEIQERQDLLLSQFREVFKTLPPDGVTEEQRFFVKETMSLIGQHLSKLRAQAEWAVAMLLYEGWRFDPGKRRLERLRGRDGLRRRRFLEDVAAGYEDSGAPGNTRAARVAIATALKDDYPPEMLSPRAYFPIWHAIQNHLEDET